MSHPIDALYNEYLGGDLPPQPTPMPAPVRELIEVTQEYHNEAPSALPSSQCRICKAIAAVRDYYGVKP